MDDWAALLREHFLFREAEALIPEALALGVSQFPRGAVICDCATPQPALGILLCGRAEAVATRRPQAVLSTFGAGGTFGAAALFGGEGYLSCIRAVTACAVLFVPEEVLRQWFTRCPRMAVDYIAFLSGRIRFLNGKLAVFTQDSVRHRLYRWLCSSCDTEGRLPPELTMTTLAATLSVGRTSLYRALEELEKSGLIVRHGKRIEVLL